MDAFDKARQWDGFDFKSLEMRAGNLMKSDLSGGDIILIKAAALTDDATVEPEVLEKTATRIKALYGRVAEREGWPGWNDVVSEKVELGEELAKSGDATTLSELDGGRYMAAKRRLAGYVGIPTSGGGIHGQSIEPRVVEKLAASAEDEEEPDIMKGRPGFEEDWFAKSDISPTGHVVNYAPVMEHARLEKSVAAIVDAECGDDLEKAVNGNAHDNDTAVTEMAAKIRKGNKGLSEEDAMKMAKKAIAMKKKGNDDSGENDDKDQGLGVGGGGRGGNPKTEEERKETHKRRFGNENLPPRGTGLKSSKEDEVDLEKAKRVWVPGSGKRKGYFRQDPRTKKTKEAAETSGDTSKTTIVGDFTVYHKAHSGMPEAHEGGPWFFEPTKESSGDVYSSGFKTREQAAKAAKDWAAEQEFTARGDTK